MRRVPNTRTREDLAHRVSVHTGVPVHSCRPWVKAVVAALADMLMEADPELRIELRNHGVYTVKRTRPRQVARGVFSGRPLQIPARRKVHFKPSRRVKQFLDKPLENHADD